MGFCGVFREKKRGESDFELVVKIISTKNSFSGGRFEFLETRKLKKYKIVYKIGRILMHLKKLVEQREESSGEKRKKLHNKKVFSQIVISPFSQRFADV